MGSYTQLVKPLATMISLLLLVFIIRSPVGTWLNPPGDIPNQYKIPKYETEIVGCELVTSVADGDTLTLDGDEKVRLLGIDTPELSHPAQKIKEECFGKDAKARLEQLVLLKSVCVGREKRDKDKYKRSLRYIFLPDPQDKEKYIFINSYLIGEGYARAYILEKDLRYKELITLLQEEAKEDKRGLWGKCDRNSFRW